MISTPTSSICEGIRRHPRSRLPCLAPQPDCMLCSELPLNLDYLPIVHAVGGVDFARVAISQVSVFGCAVDQCFEQAVGVAGNVSASEMFSPWVQQGSTSSGDLEVEPPCSTEDWNMQPGSILSSPRMQSCCKGAVSCVACHLKAAKSNAHHSKLYFF